MVESRPYSEIIGKLTDEFWMCRRVLNVGSFFRWSFGPLFTLGSIESTAIVTTHPSLEPRYRDLKSRNFGLVQLLLKIIFSKNFIFSFYDMLKRSSSLNSQLGSPKDDLLGSLTWPVDRILSIQTFFFGFKISWYFWNFILIYFLVL